MEPVQTYKDLMKEVLGRIVAYSNKVNGDIHSVDISSEARDGEIKFTITPNTGSAGKDYTPKGATLVGSLREQGIVVRRPGQEDTHSGVIDPTKDSFTFALPDAMDSVTKLANAHRTLVMVRSKLAIDQILEDISGLGEKASPALIRELVEYLEPSLRGRSTQ